MGEAQTTLQLHPVWLRHDVAYGIVGCRERCCGQAIASVSELISSRSSNQTFTNKQSSRYHGRRVAVPSDVVQQAQN